MKLPSPWIVNASPFIGLAKIDCLPLLSAPDRDWFIPEVVTREIAAGPAADPAVIAVQQYLRSGTKLIPATDADPRLAPFRLDAGEEAVLTEALARPQSAVVIDDGAGRRAAGQLGVPCTGTLGILILARRSGQLPALAPAVRALKAAGIFLPGDTFLDYIMKQFQEVWP